MVTLPGGTFDLGERGDRVSVAPFELDVTEVTVDAYDRCVSAGACSPPAVGGPCNWKVAGRGHHPVNCVSWDQATAFCGWAGKRLPTEEEWEWAARGGERGNAYPWGNAEPTGQACWRGEGSDFGSGKVQGTCPVGSYPAGATPDGILDLAGNVWEWTSSPWEPAPHLHVARGGGWEILYASYLRVSNRDFAQAVAGIYQGFRCARTVAIGR